MSLPVLHLPVLSVGRGFGERGKAVAEYAQSGGSYADCDHALRVLGGGGAAMVEHALVGGLF